MNTPEVPKQEFDFYITKPYGNNLKYKATFTGDARDNEWWDKARCSTGHSDSFYAEDAETQKETAFYFCRAFGKECPVQLPCLIDAMERDEHWGVRGGLTERERRLFTQKHGRHLLDIMTDEAARALRLDIDRSTNPEKYAHIEVREPVEIREPVRRSFLPGVEFGPSEQQAS